MFQAYRNWTPEILDLTLSRFGESHGAAQESKSYIHSLVCDSIYYDYQINEEAMGLILKCC